MGENKILQLPVVVIGAGPSGIAAALSLARAGIKVILLESNAEIGGKVKTIKDDRRIFEHGVHGWWPSYYNFDRLIQWLGVNPAEILHQSKDIRILLEGGKQVPVRPLNRFVTSPLFLIPLGLHTPVAGFRDMVSLFRFTIHMLAFDPVKDEESYTNWSFNEFLDYARVSTRAKKVIFEPFTKAFCYSQTEDVSASVVISALKSYLLPSQNNIFPRWIEGSTYDLIFKKFEEKFTELGGTIIKSTLVKKLDLTEAEPIKVVVSAMPAAPNNHFETSEKEPLGSLPKKTVDSETDGLSVKFKGEPLFIKKGTEGNYIALSRTCTHAGCEIAWNGISKEFECPCHGGIFDRDGNVIFGPPPEPLRSFETTSSEDTITIYRPVDSNIEASLVVIATDIGGASKIIGDTIAISDEVKHTMGHLTTNSVLVIRFWFSNEIAVDDKPQSVLTPLLPMCDAYFCLSKILSVNSQAVEHVVEIQVSAVKSNYLELPDETLLALAFNDLSEISSDYTRDKLIDYRIQRHIKIFTAFPADTDALGLPNRIAEGVYIAGDWTARDNNSWMMERAVETGVLCAGKILNDKNIGAIDEVISPPKAGLLLRLFSFIAFLIRTLIGRGFNLPNKLTPAEISAREQFHMTLLGYCSFLITLCHFLPLLNPDFGPLLQIGNTILIGSGLFYFCYVSPADRIVYGSWVHSLSNKSAASFRLMALGALAIGIIEFLFQSGNIHNDMARAALPAGLIAFGFLMTLQFWGKNPLKDRQFREIGFFSVIAGLCLGLYRYFDQLSGFAHVFPMVMLCQAYIFITYMQDVPEASVTGAHIHQGENGTTEHTEHEHSEEPHELTILEKSYMEHDRLDHVINGWACLAISFCTLLPLINPEFNLLLKVWPLIFLANNLYFFLHIEPWVKIKYKSYFRTFSDSHTLQHRIMTAGGIGVGILEILIAYGWIHFKLAGVFYPVGLILFGFLFMQHHWGEDPLSDRQHRDIGFIAILSGLCLGLFRFFPIAGGLNLVWPVLLICQGYIFISYMATTLHGGHSHSGGHTHTH